MDLNVLSTYRSFLDSERQNLLDTQFNSFVENLALTPSAKSRRNFIRLMDILDDNTKEWTKNLDKIYTNNFLFDILSQIPNAKERDLKRTTQAVCDFIASAGCGNRAIHRAMRAKYIDSVTTALSEMDLDATLRKSPEFGSLWTGNLKERLNTKRNK